MTLLDRILERGFEMPMDPIIAARVDRHIHRIKPDPLFQRRLRGQVVNRYVATREGMLAATRPASLPRRGLSALGRGMLYASLLTSVSATAVGAAAQQSLPGDLLYGVKVELESIRMELAPADMRDELAALALNERLEELEALAAAGRWAQLDQAVAAVERARAALAALTGEPAEGSSISPLDEHVNRLSELLATAPAQAQPGLTRALEASGGAPSVVDSRRDHQGADRGQHKGQHALPVAPPPSGEPTPVPAAPTAISSPTTTPSGQEQPDPTPAPTGQGGGSGGRQDANSNSEFKDNGATQ